MISKLCNALTVLILIAVLLVTGLLLVPRLFGFQVYGVLSGSMEPTFHVGSVVYVKPAAPEEVSEGDPITFRLGNGGDLVATHRVLEIREAEQSFVTKGDANEVADMEPIPFANLIGRAVFTVPFLGYLSMFFQTKKGILVGVGILLFVILLSLISSLTDPKEKAKREAKAAGDGKKEQNP